MSQAELLSIAKFKKAHDQLGDLAAVAWRVFGGTPIHWNHLVAKLTGEEGKTPKTPSAALEAVVARLVGKLAGGAVKTPTSPKTPRAALEAVAIPLINTTIAEVKAVRDLGPLAKSVLEELAKPGVVKVEYPEGLTLPHNKVLRDRAEKLLPRNTCVDLVIKAKWKEPSFNDVVEFIKQEQQQQQQQQQQQ